mmetsp:Transcript_10677/g.17193  ORF Transcript_10677/g.17193 Transcript_10677/m.17193 type:complete len:105 (+) Transcript_10677:102-416(+)
MFNVQCSFVSLFSVFLLPHRASEPEVNCRRWGAVSVFHHPISCMCRSNLFIHSFNVLRPRIDQVGKGKDVTGGLEEQIVPLVVLMLSAIAELEHSTQAAHESFR